MSQQLYGAIEAGGTKFICALAREPDMLLAEARIPTTTPAETLGAVIEFFATAQRSHGFAARFGIAAFGPLELNRASPRWGHILDTPKPGWSGTDLVGPIVSRFGKALAIDTDVNAAALAEFTLACTMHEGRDFGAYGAKYCHASA